MLRLGRVTGTSVAEIERMYWDRALSWWPEAMELLRDLRKPR